MSAILTGSAICGAEQGTPMVDDKAGPARKRQREILASAARSSAMPARLTAARDLLKLGFLSDARKMLSSIDAAGAESVRRLSRFLDRLDAGERVLAETRTGDEPEAEGSSPADGQIRAGGILLAPAPGARRTILFFVGNGDNRFPFSQHLMQIATCHLIVVRDPARCFALCGIPRLGTGLDANIRRLRRIIAMMGSDRLACLGISAGGYAAMRYGIELGASAALTFSAPTTLDLKSEPGADLEKYPQLANLYAKAPERAIDLLPLYRETLPRPRVIAIYGEAHARDRAFAEHLAGVPGISLRPIAGFDGHTAFAEAGRLGMLDSVFAEMLALRPLEAANAT